MRDHTETQDEQHPPRWNYPKDWTPFYIRELAVGGLANGVFKEPRRAGRGLPLINVGDLYAQFGIDTNLIDRFDATPTERKRYSVHPGDIFFTRSSLNLSGIAHCNIAKDIHEPVIFECHLMRARLDPAIAASIFVAHWCRSPPARSFLMSRAKQVTMTTIAQPDVGAMLLPLPPLPEQRRIAEVLDTIDDAIRKTEQLIQKLKQMKQGLLHDLLTRGIDENGELRDPDRHPEQFRKSIFGAIPKEWDEVTLRDEVRIAHGYPFEGSGFTDKPNGPVLLTPGNFHREGGLYFEENTKYYSKIIPLGFQLTEGDIVTVMTDLSPSTLILGQTEVVQTQFSLLHNQRIGKVSINAKNRWLPMLLALSMSSPHVRRKIIREATGTTVRHTSPARILSCRVPRPGLQEQQRILDRVVAAEAAVCSETQMVRQLRSLKTGLMDDLLTGRVRTTVLDGVGA